MYYLRDGINYKGDGTLKYIFKKESKDFCLDETVVAGTIIAIIEDKDNSVEIGGFKNAIYKKFIRKLEPWEVVKYRLLGHDLSE